jgi:DNA-binding transcriptional ArsR family regulator
MSRTKHELKTAVFDDGTHAVLRADPARPRHMEVIATFYEVAHARDYVRRHSSPAEEHREQRRPSVRQAAKRPLRRAAAAKSRSSIKIERKTPATVKPRAAAAVKTKRPAAHRPKSASAVKPKTAETGVSDRQLAVLKALRSLKDKKNRVEVPVARIAKASSVPLGSVHSILVSLEKKHMIKTERQGSPKASAIYEILPTAAKITPSLNAGSHRKPPQAAR